MLGTDGGRRGRNEHPGGRYWVRDGVRDEMGRGDGMAVRGMGTGCGGEGCGGEGCGAMNSVGQLSGCVSGEC